MSKAVSGGNSVGKTQQLAGMAIFTAIVVVLQLLGSFIHFGPFSISLVLVPIVIGAALYGAKAGAWLGFVFGFVVVLLDAGPFLAVSVPATALTCISKGVLAGLAAGLTYRGLHRVNETFATAAAAVVCPVVNTGVFLLCCRAFFMPVIEGWARAAGFENAGTYLIVGFVGINFLIEMAVNVILSPVIVRLIRLARETFRMK